MKKMKKRVPPKTPSCEIWILSYADMVTLLLTFFVLLFSLSNIEVQKFKKYASVVRQGVGGERMGIIGEVPIAAVTAVADISYGLRWDVAQQGLDMLGVNISGNRITIGGKVAFDEDMSELNAAIAPQLRKIAQRLQGLRGRIEIRGHANRGEGRRRNLDEMELSFRRAVAVRDFLVKNGGVDERRIRVTSESYYRPEAEGVSGMPPPENRKVDIVHTEEMAY
jgi:chemotaxis protein MotB